MYQNFYNTLVNLPLYDMVFEWGISFGVLCLKGFEPTKRYSPYFFFATLFTYNLQVVVSTGNGYYFF